MTDSTTPGRQWIIDLIRDQYDPTPANLPELSGWDDGAEAIADAILAQLPLLVAERATPAPAPRPVCRTMAEFEARHPNFWDESTRD